MSENLFETRYDLTKKSKIREFYDSNKTLIYSTLFIILIVFASFTYYQSSNERKKILLSESYIQAKFYLGSGNREEALEILKGIVFSNDVTYSSLSLFLIINQNLIKDNIEVSNLFDHLLENNKFDNEIKNLIIYKKALHNSNYINESQLLEELKPLLNSEDSVWRAHALLLLGDIYFSKKEYIKAKDFFTQIFAIKNLRPELYNEAKSKLAFISND